MRPVLAMPRVMAWRIHHVAYVENLKPLRQSNFSTACIRPRLPSWMRSSSGRPEAWYFLAIDTTRRRFDCTKVRSASSPARDWPTQLALAGRREVLAAGLELGAGGVARLDGLGQADLVVLGEQRVLPDVGEVEADEVFLVSFNALFGQDAPLGSLRWNRRVETQVSSGRRSGTGEGPLQGGLSRSGDTTDVSRHDTGAVKRANLSERSCRQWSSDSNPWRTAEGWPRPADPFYRHRRADQEGPIPILRAGLFHRLTSTHRGHRPPVRAGGVP